MGLTETAEIIAIIRDSVLIFVFLLALFALVLSYRKLSAVLDSARRMMAMVEEVAETISDKIVQPATSGSSVASGAGKVAAFIFGLKRKKRGKGGNSDGKR